jgi:uncharacterized protein (DUF1778 family)
MHKTESISLRVSVTVKTAVERGARSEQKTVASFVSQVLVEGLVAKGFLRERIDPNSNGTS